MTLAQLTTFIDTSTDRWTIDVDRLLWIARELLLSPSGGTAWRSVAAFCAMLEGDPRADLVRATLIAVLERAMRDRQVTALRHAASTQTQCGILPND